MSSNGPMYLVLAGSVLSALVAVGRVRDRREAYTLWFAFLAGVWLSVFALEISR